VTEAQDGTTLHASCVVVGEAGVLIRGPSGSGKSQLARRLMSTYPGFSRLVCDDRVRVEARHGRVVARALPAIAGILEIRGLGLMPTAFEPAAVVRLVVDALTGPAARLPEEADAAIDISGVTLPRIVGRADSLVEAVLWRLNPSMTGL
jgi:serine kinase of HPr protein (carbohydrate metabolism regulator)